HMDIKFTQRLSYKQARMTVIVGFILGTLLSVVQIAADYASVNQAINRQLRSILEISHDPASRIAYTLDADLAEELARGLLRSESVVNARLTDNDNNVLADVSRPRQDGNYRALSDYLFGSDQHFDETLTLATLPE